MLGERVATRSMCIILERQLCQSIRVNLNCGTLKTNDIYSRICNCKPSNGGSFGLRKLMLEQFLSVFKMLLDSCISVARHSVFKENEQILK